MKIAFFFKWLPDFGKSVGHATTLISNAFRTMSPNPPIKRFKIQARAKGNVHPAARVQPVTS